MGLDVKPTGWGGTPVSPPELTAIQNAAERLKNIAVRTPLVPLHSYNEMENIYLKPENLQPIGSYKVRGAYNWAASLTKEKRNRGFSTISAGNTAMAVGFAARIFDVPARSLLPDSVPVDKLIVEGSGALSVAAALSVTPAERGKTVCILSGGSIDSKKLMTIISQKI